MADGNMTRVDVSKVAVGTRQDGRVIHRASTMTYVLMDDGSVWFQLRGKDDEPFAVAVVSEERLSVFLTELMLSMGAVVRNRSEGLN